jgi:hypothetical protein
MADKNDRTTPFLLPLLARSLSQTSARSCLFSMSPGAVHTVQKLPRETLKRAGRCAVFQGRVVAKCEDPDVGVSQIRW